MAEVLSSRIMPAFQIEHVKGSFKQPVTRIVEDVKSVGPDGDKKIVIRRLEHSVREVDEGYIVYFPQGHSQFFPAGEEDQLRRLGFHDQPKRIDMDTGEEVPDDFELSPKAIVESKTRSRRVARQVGGLGDI